VGPGNLLRDFKGGVFLMTGASMGEAVIVSYF